MKANQSLTSNESKSLYSTQLNSNPDQRSWIKEAEFCFRSILTTDKCPTLLCLLHCYDWEIPSSSVPSSNAYSSSWFGLPILILCLPLVLRLNSPYNRVYEIYDNSIQFKLLPNRLLNWINSYKALFSVVPPVPSKTEFRFNRFVQSQMNIISIFLSI